MFRVNEVLGHEFIERKDIENWISSVEKLLGDTKKEEGFLTTQYANDFVRGIDNCLNWLKIELGRY